MGICKSYKNDIKFIVSTKDKYYWRNDQTVEESYYYSSVPIFNPISFKVVVQVEDGVIKNIEILFFKSNNNNILELPEIFSTFTEFKVIGYGNVQITAYLKYNTNIKVAFN